MPRTKNSVASRERRKRYLKAAKGYYGGRSKLYRTARESVERSLAYAYRRVASSPARALPLLGTAAIERA